MAIDTHEGIELWRPRIFDEWQLAKAGAFIGGAGSNTAALVANRLYATYLHVPRGMTVDRIGLTVYEAAAGAIRLGIYRDSDLDGELEELVLDAGTVDCGTTGEKLITITQHLEPGIYGLAFVSNATPKLWANSDPRWRCPLGQQGAGIGYYGTGWWVALDYGDLPATFPAGQATVNDEWQVAVRVASLD